MKLGRATMIRFLFVIAVVVMFCGFEAKAQQLTQSADAYYQTCKDFAGMTPSTAIIAPVVEFGGAGRGMVRHLLGVLQCAITFQVIGDPGGARAVIADVGLDSRLARPPLH